MDWVLLVLLLMQVGLGLYVSLRYRWGSDWYVHTAVPWLESLFKLQPDASTITILPWTVKLHALGGFVLLALFPFTRLVHIVTVPLTYLWRPQQVVIWNRDRPGRTARAAGRAVTDCVPSPSSPAFSAPGRRRSSTTSSRGSTACGWRCSSTTSARSTSTAGW
jgi:hypothetical protein